jgi:methanogenic corrinoid protein MtbC1
LAGREGNGADERGREQLVESFQQAFAETLLQGDEAYAERLIGEAVEVGFDQGTIADEIVSPALRLVGDLWQAGEITVADEHLATEITLRMVALLRVAFRTQERRTRERVLLAAVEGERHIVGLEMVANLLTHAGYDVRMLGADVPLRAFAPALLRHRPAVLGLTATLPGTSALLRAVIEEAHTVAPEIRVVVGGPGALERLTAIPGVAICSHVSDAVPLVDALVHRAELN